MCGGDCVTTPIGEVKDSVDNYIKTISKLIVTAANALEAAEPKEAKEAKEARAYAKQYLKRASALNVTLPGNIVNCPAAAANCASVNRGPTIDKLKKLYAEGRAKVKHLMDDAYEHKAGKPNPKDPTIKQALAAESAGGKALAQIPRVAIECH
jgi:hypothetical protein